MPCTRSATISRVLQHCPYYKHLNPPILILRCSSSSYCFSLFSFAFYFFSLYISSPSILNCMHVLFPYKRRCAVGYEEAQGQLISSHSLVNFFLISFLSVSSLIIVWSVFSNHRFSFPWAPFLCFSFIFLNHHSICFRWIRVKNDITLFLILSSLSSSSPFFFFVHVILSYGSVLNLRIFPHYLQPTDFVRPGTVQKRNKLKDCL